MFFATQMVGFGAGSAAVVNPDQIGTLIGWWRPESMNESGGNLTSWTDLSGNGYTLTPQGSNPGIISGGAPGGVLDAVDIDCVSVSGNERLECATGGLNIVDYHLYCVTRIDNWTGQNTSGFLFYGDNALGTSSRVPLFISGSTGYLQNRTHITTYGSRIAQWSSSVDPSAGSWALLEAFLADSSVVGINVDDGTEVTTTLEAAVTSSGDIDSFSVSNNGSGSEGYDSTWAEIIMYNARQTSASAARAQTKAYLTSRYGTIGSW